MLKKLIFLLFLLIPGLALADPALDGQLIYLASFGRASDVQLILSQKADPNLRNDFGWPALAVAASRRDAEALGIVQLLVEAGADVNAADENKNYPLLNAVKNGSAPIVSYLLSRGADFHIRSKDGTSLREIAVRAGDRESLSFIDQTIKAEEERIRYQKSDANRILLIREYAFANCAYEYLSYYVASKQESDAGLIAAAQEKYRVTQTRMNAILLDLAALFNIQKETVERIAQDARGRIYQELEAMISNRNRRAKGIGKDSDLSGRCGKIADLWKAGEPAGKAK